MNESPQAPASLPPPKNISPWLIVIVVAVILCCLCVGVIGLLSAFGPDILHELGISGLPPLAAGIL